MSERNGVSALKVLLEFELKGLFSMRNRPPKSFRTAASDRLEGPRQVHGLTISGTTVSRCPDSRWNTNDRARVGAIQPGTGVSELPNRGDSKQANRGIRALFAWRDTARVRRALQDSHTVRES